MAAQKYRDLLIHLYKGVVPVFFYIFRKEPAEPEYEVCWQVSEANELQTSYSVEQADIFQYQSYSAQ
jgi:hypothetical protein